MTPGENQLSPPAAPGGIHGSWRRRTGSAFQWLHIYASLAASAVLLFFAVTGFTLNHADWFYGNKIQTRQYQGEIPREWVNASDPATVARLEVVECLRSAHGIRGAVSDFRVEDSQCAVSFKGPGYTADASIDRTTGKYELTETRMGFVAIMNDLHKGRDTGRGWSLFIDLAAVLMAVAALTGVGLIYFVKRRRSAGLVFAVACAALTYLAYLLWVP